jgi:hypothetical protein
MRLVTVQVSLLVKKPAAPHNKGSHTGVRRLDFAYVHAPQ